MRRSVSLVVLVLAVALAAGVPAAAQQGWIAAGVTYFEGKVDPYATGEFYLNPFSSLSFEYIMQEINVAYWYGETRGFYGQVGFSEAGTRAEAGVWAQTALSNTITASGWIGATTLLSGSSQINFVARAEAYIPITQSVFAVAGVDASFGSGSTSVAGRVAIGTDF